MITLNRTFAANNDTVPEMMEFIGQLTEDLPPQTSFEITLVCEEIFVNIASYAYTNKAGQLTVLWTNDTTNRKLTVRVEDSGVHFNPLLREKPDLNIPIRNRQIGGLGIMLIRKLTDSVEYSYDSGKNVLTITKLY